MKEWVKIIIRIFLLILFVFFISGILWKIFGSGIVEEVKNENLNKSNLKLKIENALVEDESLILDVGREGFGDMEGVRFIIKDENSSIFLDRFGFIEENGSQKFIFNLSEIELGEIISIEIVPFFENESLIESSSLDSVFSEDFDLGAGSKFVEVVEEEVVEEVEEETSSSSSSSSSSDEEVVEEVVEEEKCPFLRTIFCEEEIFFEETKQYENISRLVDFINDNFTLIDSDNFTMRRPVEIYDSRNGTEYELLRLFAFITLRNCYNNLYMAYKYNDSEDNESEELKYGFVVVYRETGYLEGVDEPRYFYLDEGKFKILHYGWTYGELILLEDERRNIYIEEVGFLIDKSIWSNAEEVINVTEWYPRSIYEN